MFDDNFSGAEFTRFLYCLYNSQFPLSIIHEIGSSECILYNGININAFREYIIHASCKNQEACRNGNICCPLSLDLRFLAQQQMLRSATTRVREQTNK